MTSFPLRELNLEDNLKKEKKEELSRDLKEKLGEKLFEEETAQIEKINEKGFIKSDPWASAIISLYLNGIINPEIEEEHIDEFFVHYENLGYGLKPMIYRKIIPIQKKGYKWEDMPSKQLRRKFRNKTDELISIVSQFSNTIVKNFSIDAKFVYDNESIKDQFGDISAFSMKKAKKRKEERSGISILFNRSFNKNKESNVIFLNSSHDEKHHNEWQSSTYLLERITEITQTYKGIGNNGSKMIKQFIINTNYEIAEKFNQKSSLFLGVKTGNEIEYINWGEFNVYVYDGEEFQLIDEGEDFYLGSAVQIIKGKGGKRIIDLLDPGMIKTKKMKIEGFIAVLICSKNLDSVLRGKRKIRFKSADELIEKLKKKATKIRKNGDSGALMFFL